MGVSFVVLVFFSKQTICPESAPEVSGGPLGPCLTNYGPILDEIEKENPYKNNYIKNPTLLSPNGAVIYKKKNTKLMCPAANAW